MVAYEYGRIGKLAKSLADAGIDSAIVEEIMADGETVKKKDKGEAKAAWFKGAMERMDGLLDYETRRDVREACACCLGGKRGQLSKAIGRDYDTLEERIAAATKTKLVFGDGVYLQEDGTILVRFAPEGRESYRCPCLPQAAEPLPISYCFCCGGHVKHHLQQALRRKLEARAITTTLSSGGKEPCRFEFTIIDE